MVSSTHWLASAAGLAMLEKGGNAFDAAVAAGLALQVVEPHLNGPGGDAVIVLYDADEGRALVVDGQGPAPRAATIARFRELGLDLVPGTGLLPACVPGAFGAWLMLLDRFGTLDPADVMAHAIGFAAKGYPVVPRIRDTIASVEELFRTEWTSSAEIYLSNGVPEPGTLLANPTLAATYSRILAEAEEAGRDRRARIDAARRAFYEGFVAEAAAAFCASNGGLLTADDMAVWRSAVEEPVTFVYRDLEVCKAGPWTQGPVFLQQLALLDGLDLAAMGHNSADYVHHVVECAKLAFADREAYYGDPRFVDVPVEELLSPHYARSRRALVGPGASAELRPGAPGGRSPKLPPLPVTVQPELPGAGEPTGDTCHVSVVDARGNMVAATPSGGWLQSSPAIPGLGFCLGTRAQTFWLTEGLANSLEPNKRPRTTLSPTVVLRDGVGRLAFGTPGGDQQDQWSLNFFLAHVHGGLNLQEAIDAPMFHTEHFPSSFYPRTARPAELALEGRFDPQVVDELAARGHRTRVEPPWSLGRLSAVARDPDRGVLKAAANPRGMQGYALGR
ncbi:MAG: gamma-glutamyltransferase family protein [Actinomycetota bacterium]